MKGWTLAAVALIATSSAFAQQMYRWVDKDGKVHYSDKKPTTPAKAVEERKLSGSVVETSVPGFELREAHKNHPVALYTAAECKNPCNDARGLLNKRGVPFREIVVADEKSRDELQKLSGSNEVPFIMVGKSVQKGFEAGLYSAMLDLAGYPKNAGPARPQIATNGREDGASKAQAGAASKEAPPAPKGKYLPQ